MLLHLTPAAGGESFDPARFLQPHGLTVALAEDGATMSRGQVLVVPTGRAAVFSGEGTLTLIDIGNATAQLLDSLFVSAAAAFRQRLVGVLLSGAGNHGTAGLRAIKAAGGISIVQSPSDSENPEMPASALLGDQPDHSALIQQLGPLLVQTVKGLDVQRR
ncbi:hypothetical protein A9977_10535 [Variovorax sp. UMC13]|nr:hypothetical protein [Variovorax sp. UMC13]